MTIMNGKLTLLESLLKRGSSCLDQADDLMTQYFLNDNEIPPSLAARVKDVRRELNRMKKSRSWPSGKSRPVLQVETLKRTMATPSTDCATKAGRLSPPQPVETLKRTMATPSSDCVTKASRLPRTSSKANIAPKRTPSASCVRATPAVAAPHELGSLKPSTTLNRKKSYKDRIGLGKRVASQNRIQIFWAELDDSDVSPDELIVVGRGARVLVDVEPVADEPPALIPCIEEPPSAPVEKKLVDFAAQTNNVPQNQARLPPKPKVKTIGVWTTESDSDSGVMEESVDGMIPLPPKVNIDLPIEPLPDGTIPNGGMMLGHFIPAEQCRKFRIPINVFNEDHELDKINPPPKPTGPTRLPSPNRQILRTLGILPDFNDDDDKFRPGISPRFKYPPWKCPVQVERPGRPNKHYPVTYQMICGCEDDSKFCPYSKIAEPAKWTVRDGMVMPMIDGWRIDEKAEIMEEREAEMLKRLKSEYARIRFGPDYRQHSGPDPTDA